MHYLIIDILLFKGKKKLKVDIQRWPEIKKKKKKVKFPRLNNISEVI